MSTPAVPADWQRHPDHVEPPEPDNQPLPDDAENASEA